MYAPPQFTVPPARLASVHAWRTHAEVLCNGAEMLAFTTGQRTALLRDAVLAERQARLPREHWPPAVAARDKTALPVASDTPI